LEEHHDPETQAMRFLSKKSVRGGLHYMEALEEVLCFGWIDGKMRTYDARRFVQRFTPRRPDSIWSASNRERVERLTREGRMAAAGLAMVEVAKARETWDDAVRPSRVPPTPLDLEAALRSNPQAWENFRAWGARSATRVSAGTRTRNGPRRANGTSGASSSGPRRTGVRASRDSSHVLRRLQRRIVKAIAFEVRTISSTVTCSSGA
jgi:uncharacterized protein YdeI (YjbR/CyaY-like superfamily)